MNRETWLARLADLLRPLYRGLGHPLPGDLKISCGWPTHRALRSNKSTSRTVGQCFSPACSTDGITEIFISPAISESTEVGAILAHELCHAALMAEHPGAEHGPRFRRLALDIGLTGPMRATVAGLQLEQRLNWLVAQIGSYPHSGLDSMLETKKQSTRMLKLECPECGYTIRTTRQWLEQGTPTCACGAEFEESQPGGKPLVKVFKRAPRDERKRSGSRR